MSTPTETIRIMEDAYNDFMGAIQAKDKEKAEAIIVNMVDYSLSLTRSMREDLEKANI